MLVRIFLFFLYRGLEGFFGYQVFLRGELQILIRGEFYDEVVGFLQCSYQLISFVFRCRNFNYCGVVFLYVNRRYRLVGINYVLELRVERDEKAEQLWNEIRRFYKERSRGKIVRERGQKSKSRKLCRKEDKKDKNVDNRENDAKLRG